MMAVEFDREKFESAQNIFADCDLKGWFFAVVKNNGAIISVTSGDLSGNVTSIRKSIGGK